MKSLRKLLNRDASKTELKSPGKSALKNPESPKDPTSPKRRIKIVDEREQKIPADEVNPDFFIEAVRNSDYARVKEYLRRGPTLVNHHQIRDLNGDLPLAIAIRNHDYEMVRLLHSFRKTAPPAHRDYLQISGVPSRNFPRLLDQVCTSNGLTPLCLAVEVGNHYMVEFLLQLGANPNATANFDTHALKSPIQFAATRNRNTSISKDKLGEEYSADMIKVLMKYGANPGQKDLGDGMTAFDRASESMKQTLKDYQTQREQQAKEKKAEAKEKSDTLIKTVAASKAPASQFHHKEVAENLVQNDAVIEDVVIKEPASDGNLDLDSIVPVFH